MRASRRSRAAGSSTRGTSAMKLFGAGEGGTSRAIRRSTATPSTWARAGAEAPARIATIATVRTRIENLHRVILQPPTDVATIGGILIAECRPEISLLARDDELHEQQQCDRQEDERQPAVQEQRESQVDERHAHVHRVPRPAVRAITHDARRRAVGVDGGSV